MKEYAEGLAHIVKNPEKWPGFKSVDQLNELQKIAKEAKEKKSVEGGLATILIIHQIVEELFRLLLEDSILFMQTQMYPLPFERTVKNKMMFGQLISELESTVWFQNKTYIIDDAKKLNEIRIRAVHGLLKPNTLDRLVKDVETAWNLYSTLVWSGLEAHYYFEDELKEKWLDEAWPPKNVEFMTDGGMIIE